MSIKTHAKLSPSSSKRWMNCPGSIALTDKLVREVGLKSKSSIFASEGNAAHELHEMCLLTGKKAESFAGEKLHFNDFEFTVDENMIEAVQMSVDYINSLRYASEIQGYSVDVKIEVPCPLTALSIPGLDGGTSDVIMLTWIPVDHDENGTPKDILKRIDVIDYKHGAGVAVDVEHNTQALSYALGTILLPDIQNHNIIDGINITISQPRAFHRDGKIRTWNISKSELMTWCNDELKPAALETLKPNAKLVQSPGSCQFCDNIAYCPKVFETAQKSAVIEFSEFNKFDTVETANVDMLDSEHKLFVVNNAPVIRKFLTEVENVVRDEIKLGSSDYEPHLKLVNKTARRKLTEDALDYVFSPLFQHLNDNDVFEYKPRSLTEIEKRLVKSAGNKPAKQIMASITTKPLGDVVVVPQSDKRKSVSPTFISDFEEVIQNKKQLDK